MSYRRFFNRSLLPFAILCICATTPFYTHANAPSQESSKKSPSSSLKLISGSVEHPILSQPFTELLEYLEVPYEKDNLDSLMQALKVRFDRGSREIWEIPNKEIKDKATVFSLLEKVGVLSEVHPKHAHYDYAVVLGATCVRMQKRLAHLDRLYKSGVRFDRIILLSSERPLNPEIESKEQILKAAENVPALSYDGKGPLPTTEGEAFAFYLKHLSLDSELKKIPCTQASASMEEKAPNHLRPNTADSVWKWLKANPKPGSALVISNQPYVGYQGQVLQNLLPESFLVDTVGEKATPDYETMTVLNALYRWFQTEYEVLKERK